jgi:hypothetical protein
MRASAVESLAASTGTRRRPSGELVALAAALRQSFATFFSHLDFFLVFFRLDFLHPEWMDPF